VLKHVARYFADDGKAVVVAMDHGMGGPVEGFRNPRETLAKVLASEPDGILANPNLIRYFRKELEKSPKAKVAVRVDACFTSTQPGGRSEEEFQLMFCDIEECIELGADAIATLLIFGRENPDVVRENIEYLARISKDAHHYHIPLIVEVPLWGKLVPESKEERDLFMENGCRIAFELGADIIKAPCLNSREAFRRLNSELPIPVLILGGEKMDSEQDVFAGVKDAMDDGAKGVIIGRNIWQHKHPDRMVNALKGIVHENVPVAKAMEIIEG
jgi:DhnA family fructose-bisphosphate aldolase class Ia